MTEMDQCPFTSTHGATFPNTHYKITRKRRQAKVLYIVKPVIVKPRCVVVYTMYDPVLCPHSLVLVCIIQIIPNRKCNALLLAVYD